MFLKTYSVLVKLLWFGIYSLFIVSPTNAADYKEYHREDRISLSINDKVGRLFLNWKCSDEFPEPDYWYFLPSDQLSYAKFLVRGTTNLYLYIGNKSAGTVNTIKDKDSGNVVLTGPLTKVMYKRFASENYFTFNEEAYDNTGKLSLSRLITKISLNGSSAAIQSALNGCVSIGRSYLANQKLLSNKSSKPVSITPASENHDNGQIRDSDSSARGVNSFFVFLVLAGIITVLFFFTKPTSKPKRNAYRQHSQIGPKSHSLNQQHFRHKPSSNEPKNVGRVSSEQSPAFSLKGVSKEHCGEDDQRSPLLDEKATKSYLDPLNIEIVECKNCEGSGCNLCGGTGLDLDGPP